MCFQGSVHPCDVSAYSIVPITCRLGFPSPSSVLDSLPLSLTPCPISLDLSVFLLFHSVSRPFLSHPSIPCTLMSAHAAVLTTTNKRPRSPFIFQSSLRLPSDLFFFFLHLSTFFGLLLLMLSVFVLLSIFRCLSLRRCSVS